MINIILASGQMEFIFRVSEIFREEKREIISVDLDTREQQAGKVGEDKSQN
jgi:hypothetical protein